MSAAQDAGLLVDLYFAHPVGHVIEALRYALGYHRADPSLRISLVLNASAPTELADLASRVETVYAVGGCLDFLHGGDARQAIAHIPRDWDWVVDDARKDHPGLRAAFPGMAAYYDAADAHLRVARGRGVADAEPPAYLPHQQVVLNLPKASRARARQRLGGQGPRIAVMPGGSDVRALYPSAASWRRSWTRWPPSTRTRSSAWWASSTPVMGGPARGSLAPKSTGCLARSNAAWTPSTCRYSTSSRSWRRARCSSPRTRALGWPRWRWGPRGLR